MRIVAEWMRHREEVDRITDRLGKPVDEGIKLVVTALRANAFPTSGSCEGHLTHRLPYPYVHLCATHDRGCRGDPDREARSRAANEHLRCRTIGLLTCFYLRRDVHPLSRLTLRPVGPVGAMSLESVGARCSGPSPDPAWARVFKRELDELGVWLRGRFFGREVT